MKYKRCTLCHKKKNLLLFTKEKYRKGGRHCWCKSCLSEYLKRYYQKNKTRCQRNSRLVKARTRRERVLFVLKYLQTHPCVDCGETDYTCLDFDHVRGRKINDINGMVSSTCSEKRILKEIKKCEVRCSNCHRRKTAKERNWYSYIDFSTMTIKE